MPCMCGDSECPSCGFAQGTLQEPSGDPAGPSRDPSKVNPPDPHCWILLNPHGGISGRFMDRGGADDANFDRYSQRGMVMPCEEYEKELTGMSD